MNGPEIATIEALTKKFTEAFRARDFAAVGSMFTTDAVICPPNSNMISGKGNIQSFWERNGMIQALRFDSMSVKSLGENAMRVIGTFTIQIRFQQQGAAGSLAAAGPQSREINAKYVFVWQKVGDEWKIESGIWNRIRPERGNFPMPAAIRRFSQNNPAGGMGPGGPGGGMGPRGGPRGAVGGQGGGGMGPGVGLRRSGMGPGGDGPRAGPAAGGIGVGSEPGGAALRSGGDRMGLGRERMHPGGAPRGGQIGTGDRPAGGTGQGVGNNPASGAGQSDLSGEDDDA